LSGNIVEILQKIVNIKIALTQKISEKIDAAKTLYCCRSGTVPPSPSSIAVAVDDLVSELSKILEEVERAKRPVALVISAPFRGGKTFALKLIKEYASEKTPPFDKTRVALCSYISLREQGTSWINVIKEIIIEGGPDPWIGLTSQILSIESTLDKENFEERALSSLSKIFGKEISKLLIEAAKNNGEAEERLKKLFKRKEYLRTIMLPSISEHDALSHLIFMLKTLSQAGITILLIDELEVLGIYDFADRQRFLSLLMSLYEKDIPKLLLILACERKRLNDIIIEYDSFNRFKFFELKIKDFTINDIKLLTNKISRIASIVYKSGIMPVFPEEWYKKVCEDTGGRRGEVVQRVTNEIIKWYESRAPIEVAKKHVLEKTLPVNQLSEEELVRLSEEAIFTLFSSLELEPAYEFSLSGDRLLTINIDEEEYLVRILAKKEEITETELVEKLKPLEYKNLVLVLIAKTIPSREYVVDKARTIGYKDVYIIEIPIDSEDLQILLSLPKATDESIRKVLAEELLKRQGFMKK